MNSRLPSLENHSNKVPEVVLVKKREMNSNSSRGKYYKTLSMISISRNTILSRDLLESSLILLFLTTNAMQSCFIYKPIYTFCGFVQSLFNLDHKYYVLGCFYRIYNNSSLVFALILESLAQGQQARRNR